MKNCKINNFGKCTRGNPQNLLTHLMCQLYMLQKFERHLKYNNIIPKIVFDLEISKQLIIENVITF